MTKRLGLFVWMLAAGSPALVWAQATPLSSWEESMDGWKIYNAKGQKQVRETRYSETGATLGKHSLAVDMLAGHRTALYRDGADLAGQIKGHKVAIDVTAPKDAGEEFLQVTLAAVGDGMGWKSARLVEIPQDGKPRTLIFDLSSWPIPASAEWFNLMFMTNTPETGQPKTIYLDNLRIADAPPAPATAPAPTAAAAPAVASAPTTAPTRAPAGALLASWEDGTDGWKINTDPKRGKQARGISTAETGATAGKKSLGIDLLDSYRVAIRRDGAGLAKQLKGKKLLLDVTARKGAADDFVQVAIAIATDGVNWKASKHADVPLDGKPHTLSFDISAWPLPANPGWFNLFLITSTTEGSQPGTLYIDNLRTAP